MQIYLKRAWAFLTKFDHDDFNAEFQNIRQWWNDHDTGVRKWSSVASSGGLWVGTNTISASYSLGSNDAVVFADATSAAITITLPTAVGTSGKLFFVKRTNANKNLVKIVPSGSETIDGGTAYWLAAQYHSTSLVSDGTNWMVLF